MPRTLRIASLVCAIALIFSFVGAGGAEASPSSYVVTKAPTLKLSAAPALIKGKSTKATIKLSSKATTKATLYYSKGDKWIKAGRTIAIKKGVGTTSLAPTSDRSYYVKVGSAKSNTISIDVASLTLKASAAKTLVKGKSTTASLAVSPKLSGKADLYTKSGSKWIKAKRSVTIKSGKGSTSLAPGANREYKFKFSGKYSNVIKIAAVANAPAAPKPVTSTVPASFSFTGSGWGHGVGMSQYGAYGMALAGNNETQILKHYYAGTSIDTVKADTDIRVQVFGSGSDNKSSVNVVVRSPGSDTTNNGEWRMRFYDNGESSPHETWYGINNEDLMVTRNGSTITVTRENGKKETSTDVISLHWEGTSFYQSSSKEDPYVELLNKEGGSRQTHGQYRHGRLLISTASSRINIVNTLDLNTEYLNGIAEMPSSWAPEALQAQAITARGYALSHLGYESWCKCDLVDDARDQNFSGWMKENEGTNAYYGKRWVAAVAATSSNGGNSGMVVRSGGKIANTYYFSSSGGQSENVEQVWSSTHSYLRSVDDHWSVAANVKNPNATWTDSISQAAAAKVFGLKDVKSMKITSRTSDSPKAAAYTVEATSSDGKKSTITKSDKIRIGLGLKSPWLWTIKAN